MPQLLLLVSLLGTISHGQPQPELFPMAQLFALHCLQSEESLARTSTIEAVL
jgi:hypothetical protein